MAKGDGGAARCSLYGVQGKWVFPQAGAPHPLLQAQESQRKQHQAQVGLLSTPPGHSCRREAAVIAAAAQGTAGFSWGTAGAAL